MHPMDRLQRAILLPRFPRHLRLVPSQLRDPNYSRQAHPWRAEWFDSSYLSRSAFSLVLAFLQHLPKLRRRFPIHYYVAIAGAVGVGDVVGVVDGVGADAADADAAGIAAAAAFFET